MGVSFLSHNSVSGLSLVVSTFFVAALCFLASRSFAARINSYQFGVFWYSSDSVDSYDYSTVGPYFMKSLKELSSEPYLAIRVQYSSPYFINLYYALQNCTYPLGDTFTTSLQPNTENKTNQQLKLVQKYANNSSLIISLDQLLVFYLISL